MGRLPHTGGVTRSFLPAVQRHAPPTSGYCGGAPAVEGLQARVGCIGASLRWRCSARPTQTMGGRWRPRQWPAGLDWRTPARRLQCYEHSAWSRVEGAPTRAAAGAAAAGVGPHCAPRCWPRPAHAGLAGCACPRFPPGLVVAPARPTWRIPAAWGS
jgi:hypothetical protein